MNQRDLLAFLILPDERGQHTRSGLGQRHHVDDVGGAVLFDELLHRAGSEL